MATIPVHVVIASVPERRDNLSQLLMDVARQTYPISRVTCFLNGYDAPIDAPSVAIDWSPARRSAGYRWTYAERVDVADTDILCALDDDFRIEANYIETLLECFSDNVGMVAWTGHTKLKRYVFLKTTQITLPLIIGGAGLSATRVSALRGITQHPLAGELLADGGDDELLVSIMMRERGWSIVRPAGTPPVRSIESLQQAPTASHRLHTTRWEMRRRELAKQYGWM